MPAFGIALVGFVVGGSLTAAVDGALRRKSSAVPRPGLSLAGWTVAAPLASVLFLAATWSFDAGAELADGCQRALSDVGVPRLGHDGYRPRLRD